MPGLEFLNEVVLAADATTTGAITIEARDLLLVVYRIVGYSAAGKASLRFNADSAGNYWDRSLSSAQGATTFTNTQTASTTLIRLARVSVTTGRVGYAIIANKLATSKLVKFMTDTSTAAAATVGTVELGAGEWINTAAQITSIEMLLPAAGNLLAGTGFSVYGRNM